MRIRPPEVDVMELRGDTRLRALRLAPKLTAATRFSHVTAAELHGLRMPAGPVTGALHTTGRDALRGARRFGVVGHRSRRAVTPVLIDGIRCSDPITAWCECAELLGLDDLIIMGDSLLRRRDPLADLAQLRAGVGARRGQRGVRTLDRALAEVRPRTDSARETMLRLTIRRAGFPEPVVNGALHSMSGAFIGYGDLVWPDQQIVVEYEGRQHAEDRAQFAIDLRRIDAILEARYRHIRVDATLLRDTRRLIRVLTTAFLMPAVQVSRPNHPSQSSRRP